MAASSPAPMGMSGVRVRVRLGLGLGLGLGSCEEAERDWIRGPQPSSPRGTPTGPSGVRVTAIRYLFLGMWWY